MSAYSTWLIAVLQLCGDLKGWSVKPVALRCSSSTLHFSLLQFVDAVESDLTVSLIVFSVVKSQMVKEEKAKLWKLWCEFK